MRLVLGDVKWGPCLAVPKEAEFVGFGDDFCVVGVGKQSEGFEVFANDAISAVRTLLGIVGPILVEQKTEVVLICQR